MVRNFKHVSYLGGSRLGASSLVASNLFVVTTVYIYTEERVYAPVFGILVEPYGLQGCIHTRFTSKTTLEAIFETPKAISNIF